MDLFTRNTLVTFTLAISLSGCGSLERSDRATNTEDAPAAAADPAAKPSPVPVVAEPGRPIGDPFAGTNPSPQQLDARAKHAPGTPNQPNQKLAAAANEFAAALKEQNDAAFMKAASLWKDYLDREPGMPGYESASYNYGFCLLSLGHPSEAVEHLKSLISSASDAKLVNDARILLAESLIQSSKPEEALATTFEVIPNEAREQNYGLKRDATAVGAPDNPIRPNLTQKIRLYTIRGRIYATLHEDDHAHEALERAKMLLLSGSKGKLSQSVMKWLSANYGWRQIEVQALICAHRAALPDRLSEAEFLAYADAYYGCAEPARHLYCTVLAAGDGQVTAKALVAYRGLVEAPLTIREHLPPPAREIKKPGTVGQYESDMKSLIEKTVAERSRQFRDIPACHAHDLF